MNENLNYRGTEASELLLDITADVCPLTLVRSKLLVERMLPGQKAIVLVKGSESFKSIISTIKKLSKIEIVSSYQISEDYGGDIFEIKILRY